MRGLPQESLDRLKTMWHDETATIREIAKSLHRSPVTIRKLGRALFGPRKPAVSLRTWLPEDIALLRQLAAQGKKAKEIAPIIGRGIPATNNALWKYKARPLKRSPFYMCELLRALKKRRSLTETARRFKLAPATVKKIRDQAGIAPLTKDELIDKRRRACKKSVKIAGGVGLIYTECEASLAQGWPWVRRAYRTLLERIERGDGLRSVGLPTYHRRHLASMAQEGWIFLDGKTYRLTPAVAERRAEYLRDSPCPSPSRPTPPASKGPATAPTQIPATFDFGSS
jgi:hypothetical protein